MLATGKYRQRIIANGFTLIEMLVTLAIAGLIAGLGFPAIEHAIDRQQFAEVSTRIAWKLRGARADAIRKDRQVLLPDLGPLPADFKIKYPAAAIIFYPDGTSTGGDIVVQSPKLTRHYLVDAQSGFATIR